MYSKLKKLINYNEIGAIFHTKFFSKKEVNHQFHELRTSYLIDLYKLRHETNLSEGKSIFGLAELINALECEQGEYSLVHDISCNSNSIIAFTDVFCNVLLGFLIIENNQLLFQKSIK